jgi:hypothetical protein
MKMMLAAMLAIGLSPAAALAVAPVRNGVVVVDAAQFLATLPDGDTATNGPGGGGGGRGGGRGRGRGRGAAAASAPAAVAPAPAPATMMAPPPFTFENFSINLRIDTPVNAKAEIPQAGTYHLFVRSRASAEGASFKVAIGDQVSSESFGNTAGQAGVLKPGGTFNLPAGPIKVTLTDIQPGSAVEGVFLTIRQTLTDDDLQDLQYPDDIVLLKEYRLPVQIDGVKFGDLNGDGKTDLVVLTPNYSTYAFDNSGKELWHWDAPQAGTVQRSEFEAPGNVWDFDNDGKAEVIAWRQIEDKEYIVMYDGMTGEIKHKTDWPTQPLPHVYNNFRTAIAKLHPGYPDSLVVYSDSGGSVTIAAYGPTLNPLWNYTQRRAKDYYGHYIYPVDINGDGIDEVFVSHVMLDAAGKELWNNYAEFPINNDHVDSARFVDLDGDGKLEIVAGQSDVGTTVYDALTGKLLWQRFANHNQKIEAGPYRADQPGNVVVASSRYYVGGLGAHLRWYHIDGKRIDIWPNVPIPGNPNFAKGDFKGDGKNVLFWQRFRIEPDGTGTLAFPDEVFHMFDFMGSGTDQAITLGRGGRVGIYGYKGAPTKPVSAEKADPVYRAHSISNHTHY